MSEKRSFFEMTRRKFIATSVVGGGGLALGVYIGVGGERTRDVRESWGDEPGTFTPNAWVRIDSQGIVTVRVQNTEMGQGVSTGVATMIAEELEATWDNMRFEMAPVEKVYRNPVFGTQSTGGSTSTPGMWEPLRQAGAAAKQMLLGAAAQQWGVPTSECRAEEHAVIHGGSDRRLGFGELATAASKLSPPGDVKLKDPKDYRLIGTELPRLDIPPKVTGETIYAIDVKLPDMLSATMIHPPVFGERATSFDAAEAKGMPGVREVLIIDDGVAVVADTHWQASEAAASVTVTWEATGDRTLNSDGLWQRWAGMIDGAEAKEMEATGDVEAALASAKQTIEAEFKVPYQAHATAEPMSCVAHVEAERCRIWSGTQAQDWAREQTALITGLPYDAIDLTSVLAGGGFGRRSSADEVREAVQISKAVGAPVKVIWTREEDIRNDDYRPASLHRLRAGLDAEGKLVAWSHRQIGTDPVANAIPPTMAAGMPYWMPRGMRNVAAGGAASMLPSLISGFGVMGGGAPLDYAIENFRFDYVADNPGVPVSFWRAVGNSVNPFVVECFLDEVAAAAGKDPLQIRRELLAESARPLAVLEKAAEEAGWKDAAPTGRHRGLSLSDYDGAYVAMVAEVSVTGPEVRVHRVICAVDCGRVVNPGNVRSQIAGGLVFALTATLKSRITLVDGHVEQSNFNDFELLPFSEMPEVEVHLIPSEEPPHGVGEAGVPPTMAAVANAVFAATGQRVRELPIVIA